MRQHKHLHPDGYVTGGTGHQGGKDIVRREHREGLAREPVELETWHPATRAKPERQKKDKKGTIGIQANVRPRGRLDSLGVVTAKARFRRSERAGTVAIVMSNEPTIREAKRGGEVSV